MLHYTLTATSVQGPSTLTLRVGQELRLVRDDQTSDSTRILYDSAGVIVVDQFPTFRAAEPRQTTIDIIPRGYDMDKELDVTIIVMP
jgi:hypothetical protein